MKHEISIDDIIKLGELAKWVENCPTNPRPRNTEEPDNYSEAYVTEIVVENYGQRWGRFHNAEDFWLFEFEGYVEKPIDLGDAPVVD